MLTPLRAGDSSKTTDFQAPAEATKMAVNQQHLKQAWDVSQITTKEDWLDWIQKLSVEFMRESPSHALRACMSLVDVHQPLARELFNAAFVSCWGELYDQYQVWFWGTPLGLALTNARRRILFALLSTRSLPVTHPRSWFTDYSTWPSSWNMKRNPSLSRTARSESLR